MKNQSQPHTPEIREYFIETNTGMTLHLVEKKPKGINPPGTVLLVHGSGIGYKYYDIPIKDYSMADYLVGKGICVYMVDLRGYGRSTRPNGLEVRAEYCAADLKSVVDFILNQTHLDKVNLVGHSWGGIVSIIFAARYKEDMAKLVLLGTPYRKVHRNFAARLATSLALARSGEQYLENVHYLTIKESTYAYEQEVVDWYAQTVGQSYAHVPAGLFLDMEFFEFSRYVSQITAPTLLVNGNLEYVVDCDDAFQCLSDLGAAEKDLLYLGNAMHLPFLDRIAHRRLNQSVAGWLAGWQA